MTQRAGDLALTSLLAVIAATFAFRASPLTANVDDHVRLYLGGRVGAVQLRGGTRAEELRVELHGTTESIRNEFLASRFVAAQTPYSPLSIAWVAALEVVRPIFGPERILPWILRTQTLLWAVMLTVALWARRRLPACPVHWFVATGLTLAWIHAHTSPFYSVPRSFACLFTGLAVALGSTGASARWAAACLALAAVAHPYTQAMNVSVALPAGAILAGTAAAPALRGRAGLALALAAIVTVAGAAVLTYAANPRGTLGVGAILGERATFDFARNWRLSEIPMQRLAVGIGIPLSALAYRYAGVGRAAILAGFLAATLLAAGVLPPVGHYPTEYLSRIGGAWSAVLLGLCLRGNLLPDLSSISVPHRLAVVVLTGLVALPAALPELVGAQHALRPWGGWPGGIRLSRVEIECLRILRQDGWPARH